MDPFPFQPLSHPETQAHLWHLFQSLIAEESAPFVVLNKLILAGFLPEQLVGPACATWMEGPARPCALVALANAAPELEPMQAALLAQGFPDLAVRAMLLERRPEWAKVLRADWPANGPEAMPGSLDIAFSGAHYGLPRGPYPAIGITLSGGPHARGLRVEERLTLKNLRRPSRLGLIQTGSLILEGCTPMPRRAQIRDLTLQGSRLHHLPPLPELGMLTLQDASLMSLPRGLKAGPWIIRRCPRLRRLPKDWMGTMVTVKACKRLERIPRPAGVPLIIAFQDLPRLQALGDHTQARRMNVEACGLARFPRGLRIQSDLAIRNCPRLQSLGPETEVGGDLIIEGVPMLKNLPADLVVRGRIRWD